MKSLLVLFVSLSSLFANAQVCAERSGLLYEGRVINHQILTLDQYIPDGCDYQVQFEHFETAFYCPLHPGAISQLKIKDPNCVLKNGDKVSGTLVLSNDNFLDLK